MDLNLDDDGIKYPSIDDLKEILKTKHTMLLNGEYDLPTRAEKRLIEHHKDEYSYYKLLVCFIEQYKIKNFVLVECNETDVGITNKMVQFETLEQLLSVINTQIRICYLLSEITINNNIIILRSSHKLVLIYIFNE